MKTPTTNKGTRKGRGSRNPAKAIFCILLAVIMTLSLACSSGGSNPLIPEMPVENPGNNDASATEMSSIGSFTLEFDPETESLDLIECRTTEINLDITQIARSMMAIEKLTWDPVTRILDFDLRLDNQTGLNLYDVRCFIRTESLFEEGWDACLNPDAFLNVVFEPNDEPLTPFVAFVKDSHDRLFAAGGSDSQNFMIYFPEEYGLKVELNFMASWPTQCQEPYDMANFDVEPVQGTNSMNLKVEVYDHQSNAGPVLIDTSAIGGGIIEMERVGDLVYMVTVDIPGNLGTGTYEFNLCARDPYTTYELTEFYEFEFDPTIVIPPHWHVDDYPIPAGYGHDLGVIGTTIGPRNSDVLMARSTTNPWDEVAKWEPGYVVANPFVNLVGYDPGNPNYVPYPVERIDATNRGAFSFTNTNWSDSFPGPASAAVNAQLWSVFNAMPNLATGPMPFEGRYMFPFLLNQGGVSRPVDVSDDFDFGQYALFTTEIDTTVADLIYLGLQPPGYTRNNVRYVANLDSFTGVGTDNAIVHADRILAIDVRELCDPPADGSSTGYFTWLYILEEGPNVYEVDVFQIMDDAPGWGLDSVTYIMTIYITPPPGYEFLLDGLDIELLPENVDYDPHPYNDLLAVLVTFIDSGVQHGEVLIYDAVSGAFIETIGAAGSPALENTKPYYLDVDDGDFDIHVSNTNLAGQQVTVLDYF